MPPQPQPTSSSRWPGCRSSLRATRSYFVELRLLQRGVVGRVDRAGVGHRRPEDQLVERVGDVVVVVDRLGVAAHRVPEPLEDPPHPRRRLLRRRGRRPQVGRAPSTRTQDDELGRRRRPELQALLQHHQRLVGVARVHALEREVAGDVGAADAEVGVERGQQVGQPALVAQVELERRVLGTAGAAVVRREPQRQRLPQQAVERLGDRELARAWRLVIVVAPPCRRGWSVGRRGRSAP